MYIVLEEAMNDIANESGKGRFDINLMYIVLEEGKLCLTAGD
jgi:hypothetical protein